MSHQFPHLRDATAVLFVLAGLGAATALAQAPSAAPTASTKQAIEVPSDLPRALSELEIPEAATPKPEAVEWAAATEVSLRRRSEQATHCRGKLLREYLRIECTDTLAGIRHFAGSTEEVSLSIPFRAKSDTDSWSFASEPITASVTVALRRGQYQLFQLLQFTSEYEGIGVGEQVRIEVNFPKSQKAPTVTLK